MHPDDICRIIRLMHAFGTILCALYSLRILAALYRALTQ